MKKIIFTLALLNGLMLTVSFTQASPARRGIALNHASRECAGFWPGDEFVAYALPENWQPYFPAYNPKTRKTTLVTEKGGCEYTGKGDVEKCCHKLGYTYVSDNIGKGKKTILRDKSEFLKGIRGPDRR